MPPPSQPAHPPDDLPADDPRRALSALADGQADAGVRACEAWRADAAARQTWHAYHLIGDVMRSEELAREPAHDADFLATLRERLAAEPVVLAPEAPAPRVERRQPWLMPAAAAAGFVAVAGVLLLTRLGAPGASAPAAVMASASGPAPVTVGSVAPPAERQDPQRETVYIRDPRLEEYLRAHQAAGGGVAAAWPGGTLRRVDAPIPAGAQR